MAQSRKVRLKYLSSNDEFKSVYEYAEPDGTIIYEGKVQINKRIFSKMFPTAREAAIHADKILLQNGKEPINILKRK